MTLNIKDNLKRRLPNWRDIKYPIFLSQQKSNKSQRKVYKQCISLLSAWMGARKWVEFGENVNAFLRDKGNCPLSERGVCIKLVSVKRGLNVLSSRLIYQVKMTLC